MDACTVFHPPPRPRGMNVFHPPTYIGSASRSEFRTPDAEVGLCIDEHPVAAVVTAAILSGLWVVGQIVIRMCL